MKVAAAIFRNGDNVLLMRRAADQPLAGNVFYLMGMCNRLVRELGLLAQLKREYEPKINSVGDYQSRLAVMQKWFGIMFVE